MRRIKMILAVVSAVATMLVLAAPAMAQDTTFTPAETSFDGDTFLGSGGIFTGDFDDGFVPNFVDGDFDNGLDFGPGNAQFLIQDPNSSVGSFSAF
jgi:hypothetical protein